MSNVWLAVGGLTFGVLLQVIACAYYFGKQNETISSLKRRMETVEGKPIINHEAALASINTTLENINRNMESQEKRFDEKLHALEGTFRSTLQLALSSARRKPDDT